MRIRETKKHVDPVDPEHWFQLKKQVKSHLKKTLDIIGWGEVEGRLTLLVVEGGVGAVGQQQRAQLGPPLLGRLVQRGEPPLVCKREGGALEQNARYRVR